MDGCGQSLCFTAGMKYVSPGGKDFHSVVILINCDVKYFVHVSYTYDEGAEYRMLPAGRNKGNTLHVSRHFPVRMPEEERYLPPRKLVRALVVQLALKHIVNIVRRIDQMTMSESRELTSPECREPGNGVGEKQYHTIGQRSGPRERTTGGVSSLCVQSMVRNRFRRTTGLFPIRSPKPGQNISQSGFLAEGGSVIRSFLTKGLQWEPNRSGGF